MKINPILILIILILSTPLGLAQVAVDVYCEKTEDELLVGYDSPVDLGAIHFVFSHPGYTMGKPALLGNASLMELKYGDENDTLRILVWSTAYQKIPKGKGFILSVPLSGKGVINLETSSASDYLGETGDLVINIANSCQDTAFTGFESDDSSIPLPKDFVLHENFPNPFSSATSISYTLKENLPVRLTVYNLLGQKVVVLVDSHQKSGVNSVIWEGKDHKGNPLPSGIYFYRLEFGEESQTRKMVLTK